MNLDDYNILPEYAGTVSDIFHNQFDITWQQRYRDSGSDQRVWSIIEGENSKDDGSVQYTYNSEYFRCDEFSKDHNGTHLLFAGCSETEGQGGQIDDSWSKMIFNKVGAGSNFYNLGKAGYGWQKIITQTRIYISKYGKPDNLFILLPNIGRSVEWSAESGWFNKQEYPSLYVSGSNDSSVYVSAQSPAEYRKSFVSFATSWKLFEDFCLASGIKLLWGTWEEIDNRNFDKIKIFNNFVPLYKENLFANIESFRKDAKTGPNDLEKRDGHHGRLFHEFWAESILQEAKRRGFLDD